MYKKTSYSICVLVGFKYRGPPMFYLLFAIIGKQMWRICHGIAWAIHRLVVDICSVARRFCPMGHQIKLHSTVNFILSEWQSGTQNHNGA